MTTPHSLPKRPTSTDDLAQILAAAASAGTQAQLIGSHSMPVTPLDPARTLQPVTTVRMNAILDQTPDTITVQAGITLDALQRHLAFRGRWIPLDPPAPNGRLPAHRTLGGILATDSLGPLRLAHPWPALIAGVKWIDPAGRIQTAPDAAAIIASRGARGAIAEITLRTHPTPPDEQAALFYCPSAPAAQSLLAAALPLTPAYAELIGGQSLARNILDLPLPPARYHAVVIGFLGESGFCERQIARVRGLSAADETESLSLTAAQAGRLRLWMTREPVAASGFRIQISSTQICAVLDPLEALGTPPHFLVGEVAAGVVRGALDAPALGAAGGVREVCRGLGGSLFWTHGLPNNPQTTP